jgi:predicted nuclease of predicted toxin-antitoxin system
VRVLLDEQLPADLAGWLRDHQVETVAGRGRAGVKNGDLLQRIRGEYDALVTMDRGIEHQQNLSSQPFGVLLIRAASNRMVHLVPLVPAILEGLSVLQPGQLHRVGVER